MFSFRRKRSPKKLQGRAGSAWASVAQVAEDGDGNRWCKRVAKTTNPYSGAVPHPGPAFIDALTQLSYRDRQIVAVSLTAAKNHYRQASDFIGVVGLPLFLGLFAISEVFTDRFSLVVMLSGMLLYVLLYPYFRQLAAIAATGAESFQLLVVELEKEPERPPEQGPEADTQR